MGVTQHAAFAVLSSCKAGHYTRFHVYPNRIFSMPQQHTSSAEVASRWTECVMRPGVNMCCFARCERLERLISAYHIHSSKLNYSHCLQPPHYQCHHHLIPHLIPPCRLCLESCPAACLPLQYWSAVSFCRSTEMTNSFLTDNEKWTWLGIQFANDVGNTSQTVDHPGRI